MYIEKVCIENYKCFKGKFTLNLTSGVNLIVGRNESGKSTILEAINLALSGILNGKYLRNELSQYLFNNDTVKQFVSEINLGNKTPPPEIVIELFFAGGEYPMFEGNWNSNKENKKSGIVFKIEIDPDYQSAYEEYLQHTNKIITIPIEYYRITWKSFARDAVTTRNVPIKSVLIDSSSTKYQNGSDVYLSRIINNDLEENERILLSQAYRKMKESFIGDASIIELNKKVKSSSRITDKNILISVDLQTQNSWESSLMTYLDEIPFHQIGKGEQCIIKTNLALSHKKSKEAQIILLEEPENHLSHTKLNELLRCITQTNPEKQLIVSTHSSFVANKLGLENLILLFNMKSMRLEELPKDTINFFKKLPGYQTLRLLLCKKAVLVEGDSDELIFQKAYMKSHDGRLPIEMGIDVISVGLSFKRFLDIARLINQPVVIITDNDHKYEDHVVKKYSEYQEEQDCGEIKIFFDTRNHLNTLEPQFVDANQQNLDGLCEILGVDKNKTDKDRLVDHMKSDKPGWALKIFESEKEIRFPEYIAKAVEWCDEE